MRGFRYLSKMLTEEALRVPGVRRTKRGGYLVPWHAYATVAEMVPGFSAGLLRRAQVPSPIEHSEDPVAAHPALSEEARELATPVQRRDLSRAIKLRGGLIDWPCGSGKTLLGLAFATAFPPYRSVIVAPSTTVGQWREEAGRWLNEGIRIGVVSSGRPHVRVHRSKRWLVDGETLLRLRKRGSPEVLRLRDSWWDAELSEDERGWLRRTKCPWETQRTWELVDDLGETLSQHDSVEEAEAARGGEWAPGDYDVLVVGWGLLANVEVAEALNRWNPAVLVIDECHRGKNHKRWRARTVRDEATGEERTEFERTNNVASNIALMSQHVAACLLLTATPQDDRPRDWWGVLDLYDPYGWGSFYDFAARYCDAHQGRYGMDTTGLSNVEELKQRLALIRFSRTKAETHIGLPKLIRKYVKLTLREAGEVDYRALGDELRNSDMAGSPVAMNLAVACEQKLEWVMDRLIEHLREGDKVTVFTLLRANGARLVEQLRSKRKDDLILHADGSSDIAARRVAVKELVASARGGVLVGTLGAIGESIDGMQHVDAAYVLTVPWTPRIVRQAEGRFERLGGQKSVVLTYVRMAGTIDEKVWDAVSGKLALDGEIRDDADTTLLSQELSGNTPEGEAAALAELADLLTCWEEEMGNEAE